MKEEISIKVAIGDRVYPLKVDIEEEESIRLAAKEINEKLRRYKEEFAIKDKQVLLSMCVLEYATEVQNFKSRQWIEDDGVSSKIKAIENLLDKV